MTKEEGDLVKEKEGSRELELHIVYLERTKEYVREGQLQINNKNNI